MLTEQTMYWITRLDSIHAIFDAINCVFAVLFIASLVAACVVLCIEQVAKADATWAYGEESREKDSGYRGAKEARKFTVRTTLILLPFVAVSGIAAAMMPTTKEYCAIKVVPAIVNGMSTAAPAQELRSIANAWLESQLQEVSLTSSN